MMIINNPLIWILQSFSLNFQNFFLFETFFKTPPLPRVRNRGAVKEPKITHQIMIHSQKSDFEILYSESWMIGPDQITVPVRFGTLVRFLFGPVRGPNLIGPSLLRPVRGPPIWSVFSLPVRVGPVRILSEFYIFCVRIMVTRTDPDKLLFFHFWKKIRTTLTHIRDPWTKTGRSLS